MTDHPLIWICCSPSRRKDASALAEALGNRARRLFIGQGGRPKPDMDLGPEPDLALALESCPPSLRPDACVNLAPLENRMGQSCLPCPVLGMEEGLGLEGVLPGHPEEAADMVLKMSQGWSPVWMEKVQVNLPLRYLLGDYGPLVAAAPLNLEVGIDSQALDQLSCEDLEIAKSMIQGRRITVHLPFLDLAPGSSDSFISTISAGRMEKGARWALELGAVQAVAHTGFHPVLHNIGEYAARLGNALAQTARTLHEGGASLALENVFESEPGQAEQCRRSLSDEAGLPVGLCLDAGHARAFSATNLVAWWEVFKNNLLEVHLHDNMGSSDEHLPLGWGVVDWQYLAQKLAELPDMPVLTLEPHREPHLWASLRGLERIFGPWLP